MQSAAPPTIVCLQDSEASKKDRSRPLLPQTQTFKPLLSNRRPSTISWCHEPSLGKTTDPHEGWRYIVISGPNCGMSNSLPGSYAQGMSRLLASSSFTASPIPLREKPFGFLFQNDLHLRGQTQPNPQEPLRT